MAWKVKDRPRCPGDEPLAELLQRDAEAACGQLVSDDGRMSVAQAKENLRRTSAEINTFNLLHQPLERAVGVAFVAGILAGASPAIRQAMIRGFGVLLKLNSR